MLRCIALHFAALHGPALLSSLLPAMLGVQPCPDVHYWLRCTALRCATTCAELLPVMCCIVQRYYLSCASTICITTCIVLCCAVLRCIVLQLVLP